jgi:hypothetical protein
LRGQAGAQRLHRGGVQLAGAHPRLQGFEGQLVALDRVGRGEAGQTAQGQRLAPGVIGELPFDGFGLLQRGGRALVGGPRQRRQGQR